MVNRLIILGMVAMCAFIPISILAASDEIPDWIKNNAKWWSDGQITQDEFIQGIQYLIEREILEIPQYDSIQEDSSNVVPEWVKNNAGWWACALIRNMP